MAKEPLVSTEEFEALIAGWGELPGSSVDKFFPVRIWYLILFPAAMVFWIFLQTQELATSLSSNPDDAKRLAAFLYFRAWFIVFLVSFSLYCYYKDFYIAVISSILLLIGLANLISDFFNIYHNRIANPTPHFTLVLMLRVVAIWFLFLNIKNISRIPSKSDRFNLFLIFRKSI